MPINDGLEPLDDGLTPLGDSGLTPLGGGGGLTPVDDGGLTPVGGSGLTPVDGGGLTPLDSVADPLGGGDLNAFSDGLTPVGGGGLDSLNTPMQPIAGGGGSAGQPYTAPMTQTITQPKHSSGSSGGSTDTLRLVSCILALICAIGWTVWHMMESIGALVLGGLASASLAERDVSAETGAAVGSVFFMIVVFEVVLVIVDVAIITGLVQALRKRTYAFAVAATFILMLCPTVASCIATSTFNPLGVLAVMLSFASFPFALFAVIVLLLPKTRASFLS